MMSFKNMDKTFRVLIYAMIALVILVPIGLIATGTAYGEWGPDELQQAVGYVPAGLQQLNGLWSAPLQDYGLPGQGDTLPEQTPGYYVSAIVGCVVVGGVAYLLGKTIIKRND